MCFGVFIMVGLLHRLSEVGTPAMFATGMVGESCQVYLRIIWICWSLVVQ